jgi:hypothetical protein
MGKPVPPRLPPVRVLNAEQNAFIQSLEPQSVHVAPVTESTEQPSAPSPDHSVSVATEQPSTLSPHRPVSIVTGQPSDSSPDHSISIAIERSSALSPDHSVSVATEQPSTLSPHRPVSMATERLSDQSPHHPTPAVSSRPARSRANKRQGRALFERADGKTVRKLSFYIPADVAKSLQLHCVANERDMSTFVTDLVRRALAKANA